MILMVFIRRTDRPEPVPAKDFFTRERVIPMIRFGLLLAVASFASMALRRIDAIVLGAASLKLVGVYTTAIFIAAFIEVPLGALERISHTRVSDCFARNDMQQVEKIYRDSVKYLLLAGGLLFILIVSCTRHIYELGNLPQSYSDCIGVVYIVGLGALINISTGTNSALLFYSSFYLSGTLWLIGTLILVLLLNLWLIPVYGIYGAAIASLTGSFVYNLMKFLFIFVKFGFQPYNRRSLLIAAIIAVIAAGGVLFPAITGNALVNLLIKGSILTISYLGVIYYMRLAPEIYTAAFNRIRSFTHKGRA
jgi:O-antigen/teichoic acid export membrane protein